MYVIRTIDPERADSAAEPPHPDADHGAVWTHRIVGLGADGFVAWGDSQTAVVAACVDRAGLLNEHPEAGSYEHLDDDEAEIVRRTFAIHLANGCQGDELIRSHLEDGWSPTGEPSSVRAAVENHRSDPWQGHDGSVHWDNPATLWLVDTSYAPFTDLPAPTGNVAYVRPGTEPQLLGSMAEHGFIDMAVREPHGSVSQQAPS